MPCGDAFGCSLMDSAENLISQRDTICHSLGEHGGYPAAVPRAALGLVLGAAAEGPEDGLHLLSGHKVLPQQAPRLILPDKNLLTLPTRLPGRILRLVWDLCTASCPLAWSLCL